MFPKDVPHIENHPLSKETTYRIGGPAKIFALPESEEHLRELGQYLKSTKEKYFVLGAGSNLLAPDAGFDGVIIATKKLNNEITLLDEHRVQVGASVMNNSLLRFCADKGLGGIEILSGVPGNLGGAIYMNAGTADGWIEDYLEEVHVYHLLKGRRTIPKTELKYSYREQHFLAQGEIITGCILKFRAESPEVVKKRLGECARKRKEAQPIEMPSCGSVFRNPPGQNAWKLIDQAGLKGFFKGGARFSLKHCNFIVNEGGATQEDVLFLIQEAKNRVYNQGGVELVQEVITITPRTLC